MKVIWKYELNPVKGPQSIRMPCDSTILDVQMQDGIPVFWALVDPDSPDEERKFLLVYTGWAIPGYPVYIGTFQDGPIVYHLFEQFEEIPF